MEGLHGAGAATGALLPMQVQGQPTADLLQAVRTE